MTVEWRNYQEAAADFFRRFGLTTSIEKEVEGARGTHVIDVYVEGSFHGIPFKWIVECKAWKSNIPKEKVMALAAIVQDIGADRGFLLSETGFQSGAVRATQKTNITLTSLEDLAVATEEHFIDSTFGTLNWRLHKARTRLREIKKEKYDDDCYPPMFFHIGKLSILECALADALKGDYPTIYRVENEIRYQAESLDELLMVSEEIISEAEQWSPPED